jgi:hypothetical protein
MSITNLVRGIWSRHTEQRKEASLFNTWHRLGGRWRPGLEACAHLHVSQAHLAGSGAVWIDSHVYMFGLGLI